MSRLKIILRWGEKSLDERIRLGNTLPTVENKGSEMNDTKCNAFGHRTFRGTCLDCGGVVTGKEKAQVTKKQAHVLSLIQSSETGGIVVKYSTGNIRTARAMWQSGLATYSWAGGYITMGPSNRTDSAYHNMLRADLDSNLRDVQRLV